MKYQRVFEQLRNQSAEDSARNPVSIWLHSSCNNFSYLEDRGPSISPPPNSHASPQASSRQDQRRQPLQSSPGNQLARAEYSKKRKMDDCDDDTAEQLGRKLRSKATLRMPTRYPANQEHGPHIQKESEQELGSLHPQGARGRAGGIEPGGDRGLERGPMPRFSPLIVYQGHEPTAPGRGRGRGSRSPEKSCRSPTKSGSDASSIAVSKRAQMAHFDKPIRYLSSSERFTTPAEKSFTAALWLNYIKSTSQKQLVPSSVKVPVSPSLLNGHANPLPGEHRGSGHAYQDTTPCRGRALHPCRCPL